MHTFTATTILARAIVLDLLNDGGPIVIDLQNRIGTYISDKQHEAVMAALTTLTHEIDSGTDAEIREAQHILTEQAYAAQESIEVDAK